MTESQTVESKINITAVDVPLEVLQDTLEKWFKIHKQLEKIYRCVFSSCPLCEYMDAAKNGIHACSKCPAFIPCREVHSDLSNYRITFNQLLDATGNIRGFIQFLINKKKGDV
jgi:hypothetical protein